VLFSNRSACYAGLKKFEEALSDAEQCISLKPDFHKGFGRKGAALFGLGKLQEASAAYEDGLKVAPGDANLTQGLNDVRQAGSQKGANQIGQILGSPQAQAKLATDPRTAGFMKDPQFQQVLAMASQNPQMFQMLMQQDQRIMTCLSVVLGADLGGGPGGPPGGPSDAGAAPEPTKPAPKKEPEKKPEPAKELTEEEKEAAKLKEEGDAEKAKGTTAYKAKDFDTAIGHYTKAFEINGVDMSYLTNRAACHFEKGEFEECIKDCEQGIEVGRMNKTDFKVMARAFSRIGNSYHRLAKKAESTDEKGELMGKAIDAYNKSLTEHRTDDVWTKLKKVQNEKKKMAEQAYIDPEKANEEKEAGKADFTAGKWVDAMRHYSEAIKRNPKDPEFTHIVFSNRATCYIRMNEMELAMKDLDTCIEMCPTYAKAYLNKAHIKFVQKEYQKVTPLYEAVINMEGVDEDSKKKAEEGLQRTMHAVREMQSSGADEEQLRRAQADPEIQQILGDPAVQQVLRDFKDNPKYAQQALRDPYMSGKLNKLAAAGIIRFG